MGLQTPYIVSAGERMMTAMTTSLSPSCTAWRQLGDRVARCAGWKVELQTVICPLTLRSTRGSASPNGPLGLLTGRRLTLSLPILWRHAGLPPPGAWRLLFPTS
jgi:hypothetical protein